MKIAYIMRGVQGSGKSTVARQIAGETGVIHSTDDLFIVDGEYRHDPKELEAKHRQNFENFCKSIEKDVSVVICDNTNVRIRDYLPYQEAAEKAGYIVAVVSMPHPDPEVAAARNLHNVSADIIRKKIEVWEN